MPKIALYKLRILGLIDMEKYDLASYQLKDVAKSWYKVWLDSVSLEGGPITWDLFKMDFLGWLFPT